MMPDSQETTAPAAPARRFVWDWEMGVYLGLILVAAVMRLWDLGSRAFLYDESLHAFYSWSLYVGRGYEHTPMMHGPFQFHLTAFFFFLFGATDYTARILPAILGTVLVGLPYFLRRELGRGGALAVAVLLAFSPFMLYYSRTIRNDIYVAAWALLLVICLFQYVREHNNLYLYLAAAAMSLSFCSKETTYITVAIFGSFLFLVTIREWVRAVRNRFDFSALSPRATFFLLMATLALPLAAPLATFPMRWAGLNVTDPLSYLGIKTGVFMFLFLVAIAIGLRWRWRTWLISALIFWGIYTVLYTTFFTNFQGFATGVWGSLSYWLEQHGEARGGQPWFYYAFPLLVYEFLPLIFGIAGAVYSMIKGGFFRAFLFYWGALAIIVYSVAGEKMPWLTVHLALPLSLLAGKLIGDFLEGIDWRGALKRGGIFLIIILPLLPLALRLMGEASAAEIVGLAIISLIVLGLSAFFIWRVGITRSLQLCLVAVMALCLVFTVRASWRASYQQGDIPGEMITYAQGAPDQLSVMREIDRLAWQTGKGKDLPITVDTSIYWGMLWYLRDYKDIEYVVVRDLKEAPRGSVVITNSGDEASLQPYLDKYGAGSKFLYLWWPSEAYKGLTFRQFLHDLTDFKEWQRWWDYFVYRKSTNEPLLQYAVVYFSKDFSPTLAPR